MMYKLENGKLVEAPVVWRGIVGYNKNLDRLVTDGWKPLIVTGDGSVIEYIEHKDHIEEKHSEPPYDYRALRRAAYPELGDVIDAMIKAYQGETGELEAIITERQIIKNNIKKTQDAD